MKSEVSIILPCAFNDGFENCVDSIDFPARVVTVLNGADDALAATVAAYGAPTVVMAERNLGAACNAGCEAAKTDLVLLMNTNCTFSAGVIQQLVNAWAPGTIIRATLQFDGDRQSRVIQNFQDYVSSDPPKAFQPGLLFHKSIRQDIGGYFFDPDIHWTEDADFDRRARAAGYDVIVVPGVVNHARVTIASKLRSAYRYGLGRAAAEMKELSGTEREEETAWSLVAAVHARYGTPTALYALLWQACYSYGKRKQRATNVLRVQQAAD